MSLAPPRATGGDVVRKWANLDGICHVQGRGKECCSILGRTCRRCERAFLHVQPCYGGQIWVCEWCPQDDDQWNFSVVPIDPGEPIP